MPEISVILPSHNEGDNLIDTVRCVLANSGDYDFEIVVVDDQSTDRSGERVWQEFGHTHRLRVLRAAGLGVAGARNYGAAAAYGNTFVFLDAHCFTPRGWLQALLDPLAPSYVGMVGPAITPLGQSGGPRGYGITWTDAGLQMTWLPQNGEVPYAVPLLAGGCQAIRRQVFEEVGGYDPGMTRWGSEDQEISLRLWLRGYSLLVQPQCVIHHLFRDAFTYRVEPGRVIYNRLRMALLHFSPGRSQRVLKHHQQLAGFSDCILWLLESDLMAKRRAWQARRQRDDDWFCQTFGLKI